MNNLFGNSLQEDDSDWLSISDLMAGLMVIFLFIAIIFIRPLAEENIKLEEQKEELELTKKELENQRTLLEQQQTRIAEIAVTWQETETNIFEALITEFQDDLPRWNAEIEKETGTSNGAGGLRPYVWTMGRNISPAS